MLPRAGYSASLFSSPHQDSIDCKQATPCWSALSLCIFLPICHKHTPEYLLWGPRAHFHVPSLLLLRQMQNCTQLHNGASKPHTLPGDSVKDYGKGKRVLECVINSQVIANKVISVLKCFPDLEGSQVEFFLFSWNKFCNVNIFLLAWLNFQKVQQRQWFISSWNHKKNTQEYWNKKKFLFRFCILLQYIT